MLIPCIIKFYVITFYIGRGDRPTRPCMYLPSVSMDDDTQCCKRDAFSESSMICVN